MRTKWKRNAAVATMAVLVCAAVALNWRYSGQEAMDAAREAGTKILGEATLVSNPNNPTDSNHSNNPSNPKSPGNSSNSSNPSSPKTDGAAEDESAQDSSGAAADEGTIYTGSDYFATARLTRQQARDSAISLLQEAAEQENADQAVANEASEGIQVLASYTLKEAQIENLVTAKGYTDCVAFMSDGTVSVVVSTESGQLSAEDVAKITDITMSETGLPASGIKIMPAN